MSTPDSRLSRQLGTADAVVIGMSAMIGTGVFVVWQPAAEHAGAWMLLGLALAALVAFCNATSTAQLAAVHPRAGGAYHYGRERLGEHWGALAGYAFVLGKTASCATAALAVGTYLWPEQATTVALATVAALTIINVAGVQKTVRTARIILTVVVTVLVVAAVAGLAGLGDEPPATVTIEPVGPPGVFAAAAVLFYAFAGYARVTVLGEEVRDPARTIPRAVTISLLIVLGVYAAIGATVLGVLGSEGAAASDQPLRTMVETADAAWLVPVVTVGAGIAAMGTLLSLLAGIGRTSFAMASDGDLPRVFAAVHPERRVPHVAELGAGIVTAGAVLSGDLAQTLSISAFAVLVYYAVANLAALTLPPAQRLWPRWLSGLGLLLCIALAISLPTRLVALGSLLLGALLLLRVVVHRIHR
ncbi:amino acid permease [Actinobacteria bacterium YIM 96077]|uniref:Amino acid permease n=1 Tax=Phytoactinopolyspora halophila TaxID=1981511 RepID=A0A329QRV3_9ACTN|nr:amino acid permease [Phytoactinopolyspora halophila]AYY14508.1 amino acid permease [Actinobacteria bacterium YIM 96077]RAW14112.1 amino acid permease [Phytoactinopolyspora halophila]